MSNTINLAKKYSGLLDEVYMNSAVTSVLESPSYLAREGANANEIVIPKLDMDGLADYDRTNGYVEGDVSLTWETKTFNYERGRMFSVDNMDNEETQNAAFGRLAGEFLRTKAAPEIDAFRFASYASAPGIGSASGNIASGEDAVAAIRQAASDMDEAEVPADERILFITPTLKGMIEDMDTTKSRAVFAGFADVISVPQTRFYTSIDLFDGTTEGEQDGGYAKASDGKDINFMIIAKNSVIQFTKNIVPKIISPALNPDADSWKYGYRSYGLCAVFDNKTSGVFVHHKA